MKSALYRCALCVFLCSCAFTTRADPNQLDVSLPHANRDHLNTAVAQLPPPSPDIRPKTYHPGYRRPPSSPTVGARPPPAVGKLNVPVSPSPPPAGRVKPPIMPPPSGSGLNNPPPPKSAPTLGPPAVGNLNVPVSPSPPSAGRVNLSPLIQPTRDDANPAPRPASSGCGDLGQCGEPDQSIMNALAFRNFLNGIRGQDIICYSIAAMFAATLPADGCARETMNAAKTVAFQMTVTDGAEKIYVLQLRGKSAELALSETSWVERHRFYIAFGFDGKLDPHVTVFDFEPLFRTTSELFPERENLYEYIKTERDSALREFQERVKSSIWTALDAAYSKQQAEAR
jgi:hypothetical protein